MEEAEIIKKESETIKKESEIIKKEAMDAKAQARIAKEEGIQALILDNLDEQIPKGRILMKLQKHFGLTEDESSLYYDRYASDIQPQA